MDVCKEEKLRNDLILRDPDSELEQTDIQINDERPELREMWLTRIEKFVSNCIDKRITNQLNCKHTEKTDKSEKLIELKDKTIEALDVIKSHSLIIYMKLKDILDDTSSEQQEKYCYNYLISHDYISPLEQILPCNCLKPVIKNNGLLKQIKKTIDEKFYYHPLDEKQRKDILHRQYLDSISSKTEKVIEIQVITEEEKRRLKETQDLLESTKNKLNESYTKLNKMEKHKKIKCATEKEVVLKDIPSTVEVPKTVVTLSKSVTIMNRQHSISEISTDDDNSAWLSTNKVVKPKIIVQKCDKDNRNKRRRSRRENQNKENQTNTRHNTRNPRQNRNLGENDVCRKENSKHLKIESSRDKSNISTQIGFYPNRKSTLTLNNDYNLSNPNVVLTNATKTKFSKPINTISQPLKSKNNYNSVNNKNNVVSKSLNLNDIKRTLGDSYINHLKDCSSCYNHIIKFNQSNGKQYSIHEQPNLTNKKFDKVDPKFVNNKVPQSGIPNQPNMYNCYPHPPPNQNLTNNYSAYAPYMYGYSPYHHNMSYNMPCYYSANIPYMNDYMNYNNRYYGNNGNKTAKNKINSWNPTMNHDISMGYASDDDGCFDFCVVDTADIELCEVSNLKFDLYSHAKYKIASDYIAEVKFRFEDEMGFIQSTIS